VKPVTTWASSFIGAEPTGRNLEQEIGAAEFDTVRQRSEARWNEALSPSRLTGGTNEQQHSFCSPCVATCFFPTFFFSNRCCNLFDNILA
jgi:putative alpha-1,2-mannosidase